MRPPSQLLVPEIVVLFLAVACTGPEDGGEGSLRDGGESDEALRVTTTSLPAATVGAPYATELRASGGTPPYQWLLDSGSLPQGLTLQLSGTLSGTPLQGTATAGAPFALSVRVVDSDGVSADRELELSVDELARTPLNDLDDVGVYLNLGDSFAAGYNASDGRGYAAMLARNHSAYPSYDEHDIEARFPSSRLVDRAKSGATSDDVVEQVSSLPDAGARDVVVTIYVGGNDFNDEPSTMLLPSATDAAIAKWTANMGQVLDRLRTEYERPASGQELVVVIATIHDPTGGTGSIPQQFDSGFCGMIQQIPAGLGQVAIGNLSSFNDAIRQLATDQGLVLLDSNALFLDHGMNAGGDERWLDSDCAHGTNEGHHQVRREIWRLLTGEAL